ncbi:MAG TPA: CoA transferase [Pseudonocardiaceae bacterium]|jgi:crotonobetainyl-CoA:carnitine CoA-transferase CaiB-like acyl-CoA transferase|nr:CoA transferase [Pseudonocardiaceae bacterium]
MITAATALAELYREVTGEPLASGSVRVVGDDPVLPGLFRVGALAAASVGATTAAAAALLTDRGDDPGAVSVNTRHAAIAFRSQSYLRVDGQSGGGEWAPLSGDYRAADGWVKLHCNYPHHARAAARALDVPADRDAVAAAVAGRRAVEVEEAVVAAGGAAAAMRTRNVWRSHPQGQASRSIPLVALETLDGNVSRRPLPRGEAPLSGVRVLDLTHVIAGPVCGRVLAAHGADVLHVGAAHLPTIRPLLIDTGFGKRSCHLDLRERAGQETLRALVREADVLVQSYRPGALAGYGFGPESLAELRPGLIVATLSAWGHAGPWRRRRGFDSLAQLATGIADEGARAAGSDRPHPLPAQALDHASGWLTAFGVLTALRRRAAVGGTWRVRVALARTAAWLDDLDRLRPDAIQAGLPGVADIADLLADTSSQFGRITHVRMPGDLPAAPPSWRDGPHLPGSDPAEWW